jgi:WD40 repeat protein
VRRGGARGGIDGLDRVRVVPGSAQGHAQNRVRLAFSPDGVYLAAQGIDATVGVWERRGCDVATAEPRVLRGHDEGVRSVSFSQDGRYLVSASYDATVRLWDLASGGSQVLGEQTSPVLDARFSPDGTWLASGAAGDEIGLWRVAGGQATPEPWPARTVHTANVFAVAFSLDDRTLAAGGGYGVLQLWRLGTGDERDLDGHDSSIHRVIALPDGVTLASASGDRTVRLWDISGWQSAPTVEHRVLRGHTDTVWDLAASPDGSSLVTAGEDGIRLWRDELPHAPAALRAWLRDATRQP